MVERNRNYEPIVHHAPSFLHEDVELVEDWPKHANNGHLNSVPGKAPEMAGRKHEKVDTTKGLTGHNTFNGEAPVHPTFGYKPELA